MGLQITVADPIDHMNPPLIVSVFNPKIRQVKEKCPKHLNN